MSGAIVKADVERDMITAWEGLGSAVDSFSDAEMERPGVVGDWTPKDLLGHIAFWSQRAAQNLQLIAAGREGEIQFPTGTADVDEWNERERRLRQDRPLSEMREEWLESFQQAMQALADFPAERLEEKARGQTVLFWFAIDTYNHYREHLAHLNAWRREIDTTER